MRKLYTFICLIVIVTGLMISGCKKSTVIVDPGTVKVRDTMSVVLNGYSYIANEVEAYYSDVSGTILVKGMKGTLLLVINLDKEVTPGTYPAQSKILYYVDDQHNYNAIDGNITVTRHDFEAKTISGTFECTLEDPFNHSIWIGAKNGIFAINYQ